MSEKKVFVLDFDGERRQALAYVARAPANFTVEVKPTKRTDDQNRRFHAMVGDIARQHTFAGKKLPAIKWKVLLVSGHATATNEGSEIVPGLEGEFVNLRESTAEMSVGRGASLIDYTRAYGDMNDVVWTEPLTEEMAP